VQVRPASRHGEGRELPFSTGQLPLPPLRLWHWVDRAHPPRRPQRAGLWWRGSRRPPRTCQVPRQTHGVDRPQHCL